MNYRWLVIVLLDNHFKTLVSRSDFFLLWYDNGGFDALL